MKIVVLGTRGVPDIQGGVERYCENLYPQLAKEGCEVVIFTRKPYVKSDRVEYQGVKLIALPCPRNKYFEAFIHTYIGIFAAQKQKPDILHIQAIGPSLFTPLARIFGMKVVITNQGPDYNREKWPWLAKLLLRLAEALGTLCANKVICVSQSIADDIQKKYNRKPEVIPNGVAIPETPAGVSALDRYGLEKRKYILAVGRIVPEKGFHDLIESFRQVDAGDWKLVIAGGADHQDDYSLRLKNTAAQCARVVLTGTLSRQPLAELYSHAGFFVIPSYHEGLPLALLEALSHGLYCIASDIAGNRAVELEEKNYFPPKNIDALAKKISEGITSPLSESQRIQLVEMVRRKYNWETIAKKTLDVYLSVIHNKK